MSQGDVVWSVWMLFRFLEYMTYYYGLLIGALLFFNHGSYNFFGWMMLVCFFFFLGLQGSLSITGSVWYLLCTGIAEILLLVLRSWVELVLALLTQVFQLYWCDD